MRIKDLTSYKGCGACDELRISFVSKQIASKRRISYETKSRLVNCA